MARTALSPPAAGSAPGPGRAVTGGGGCPGPALPPPAPPKGPAPRPARVPAALRGRAARNGGAGHGPGPGPGREVAAQRGRRPRQSNPGGRAAPRSTRPPNLTALSVQANPAGTGKIKAARDQLCTATVANLALL